MGGCPGSPGGLVPSRGTYSRLGDVKWAGGWGPMNRRCRWRFKTRTLQSSFQDTHLPPTELVTQLCQNLNPVRPDPVI
jgi:hypothetical protein